MFNRKFTKRDIDRAIRKAKSTRRIVKILKHKRHFCKDEKTEKYLEDMIKLYTDKYNSERYHEV